MRCEKETARRSGNYDTRQNVVTHDTDIITDALGAFLAFAICMGVPTIMALLKSWGWW